MDMDVVRMKNIDYNILTPSKTHIDDKYFYFPYLISILSATVKLLFLFNTNITLYNNDHSGGKNKIKFKIKCIRILFKYKYIYLINYASV